jgi:hypothetical protein
MGLRMAGTAIAATLTIAAVILFSSPRAAVGAPGTKAPTLVVTQRFADPVLPDTPSGFVGTSDVSCLAGETVVGGGFHWGEYDSTVDDFSLLIGQDGEVVRSSQFGALGWRVSVLNTSASASIDLRATVMCAKIQ